MLSASPSPSAVCRCVGNGLFYLIIGCLGIVMLSVAATCVLLIAHMQAMLSTDGHCLPGLKGWIGAIVCIDLVLAIFAGTIWCLSRNYRTEDDAERTSLILNPEA